MHCRGRCNRGLAVVVGHMAAAVSRFTSLFPHPAGFTVDSFTLRTGPGAGSAYVYDMTANSAGVQTQG